MNAKTTAPLLALLIAATVAYLKFRRTTISAAPGGGAPAANTGPG